MKILYVIGSMQVGGAERHLFRVASELARAGHQIQVYAFQPEGPLAHLFQEQGIRVRGFHPPAWLTRLVRHERAQAWIVLLLSALGLFGALWSWRPQVLHFFLPAAYIIGGLVSMFAPPCTRIMSRRSLNYYQSKHRLFARIERWLHPKMNRVAGNSKAVLEQLADEGIARERLRLIYNGIDAAQFQRPAARNPMREQLGIAPDALVMVLVANLIPYKGHSDLIDACAGIRERMPAPWTVLLVGRDDGIQAGLEAQARSRGVYDHLRFLGSRRDIPDLLAAADIGILCSHEEGFSNAILEAMAAGLPMVVTDVGGNAEAVIDGQTGLVVPPRQPDQLGEALLKLARDPQRALMGERGRQRVQDTFSMQACVDGYQLLYRDAALKSAPAAIPTDSR